MKRIDVLNLEWTSYPSRDRNVASMVCNYLRFQGLTVKEKSIFNGYYYIEKYRPKVLFMTNATGAIINFEISKYAALKGIKVVTLVSEGNYKDDADSLDVFLWGNNYDKILYEDVCLQWSDRARKLVLSVYPELIDKEKVCGSCGADMYKIWKGVDKQQFLNKHNKGNYKKVIGIGCWDFGPCYEGGRDYNAALGVWGLDVLKRFRKDRDDFNSILKKVVEENKDVLFLVKEHPGNTDGIYMSGADGLDSFDNVLLLKFESIVDCICVSDFWVTYESTTVFEAWMAGIQTCLINPSGLDFPRANVYLGSPNYETYEQFQGAIDSFYEKGELLGFNDKEQDRRKLIESTVQWDDGFNHVRAGNEIIRVLNDTTKKKHLGIPFALRKVALKYAFKHFLPFKKTFFFADRKPFNEDELIAYSSEVMNSQKAFYNEKGLSKAQLSQIKVLD